MSTPHGIFHIFEANRAVETFGLGVALVNEQGSGQTVVGGTLGGSREELMGYALSSKLREDGKAVEVPLASGCLVVHARVVDTKLAACTLDERLSQLVQLRAVIRHYCSCHLALVGHGK